MVRIALVLTLSAALSSAWFIPSMDFSAQDDTESTNIDTDYVRYDKESVVVGTTTNKMYYDAIPTTKMHFYEAWDYCQTLDLNKHNDWRVATKNELRSLLELSRREVKIKHAFKNVLKEKYWTSTEDRYDQAYYVDFDLGRYSTAKLTQKYRVICVRDSR